MDVWHTKVATTSNIANLNAAVTTIDGVSVGWGDLVLVRAQNVASENGIFRVNSSGVLTRVADATGAHLTAGVIHVNMGSQLGRHKTNNGTAFNKL